jgi:hypothetical protein
VCWAKEFGEASPQNQVAQLAARDEGQLDVERSEIEDLRAEVERLSALSPPAAMAAAGGGAVAARQQVSTMHTKTCVVFDTSQILFTEE